MSNTPFITKITVNVLTFTLFVVCSGCSYLDEQPPYYRSNCKNHAYTQMVFEDYISKRYHSKSPVRVGIIPFSVPANFASLSNLLPGLDYSVAQGVQRRLLEYSDISIIEVFNRMDWPGKRDEFFTGNFGAISYGRQADYDFVVVGMIPTTDDFETLSAYTKLIEVESGVTVYYGKSTVRGKDKDTLQNRGWFSKARPDKIQIPTLAEDLSDCITAAILNDTPSGF